MRLRLAKQQKLNAKAQKIRVKRFKKGWENVDEVLHYQELPFISEIIWIKFISRHHNNLLVEYLGIDKTREFISWKYYWPSLRKDVEAYVKGCNICLALKAVKHKPYGNLQTLPIPTY